MRFKNYFILFLFSIVTLFSCTSKKEVNVLVFSKTSGFRHGSIEAGQKAIEKLGMENGLKVTITENADYFSEDSLVNYSAVVFLNSTGDVLDHYQHADFERFIQSGGGFVGVHAASDMEYEWPWYNKLVGAYFKGHPKVQEATLKVIDKNHPATSMLPDEWVRSDEWYNFKKINTDVRHFTQNLVIPMKHSKSRCSYNTYWAAYNMP